MSGTIRSLLGIDRKRILNIIRQDLKLEDLPEEKEKRKLALDKREKELTTIVCKLECALKRVETKLKEWEQLAEASDQERTSFEQMLKDENSVYETLCDGQTALAEKKLLLTKLQKMTREIEEPPAQITTAPTNTAKFFNLPKLKLEPFSNKYREWPVFWNAFSTAVDSRPELTDQQKMSYLIPLLKNEAYEIIRGYEGRGDCYKDAVDALKERFGGERNMIKELNIELINIKRADSDPKLSKVVNEIESIFKQLLRLNVDIEQPIYDDIIMEKIPKHVQKKIWEDRAKTKTWSLEATRKLLREKAWSTIQVEQDKVIVTHYESLKNNVIAPRRSDRNNCKLCGENHKELDCHNFTSAKDRWQRIKSLKLCTNCLGSGHQKENCWSAKSKCSKCNGNHLDALCSRIQGNIEQNLVCTEDDLNDQKYDKLLITKRHDTPSKLLAIRVEVFNPLRSSLTDRAIMLFDSCCQRSYITEELANSLSLISKTKEDIKFLGFHSNSPKTYKSQVYLLGVKLSDGSNTVLPLNTIDYIAAEVEVTEPLGAKLHTQGYKEKPDILLGMDMMFQFGFTLKVNKNNERIIITKLGTYKIERANVNEDQPDITLCVDEVKNFWTLENIGVTEHPSLTDEEEARLQFQSTFWRQNDGRYVVKFPRKKEITNLSDNRRLCMARLKANLKNLKKKKEILESYDQVIKDQLKLGIIEVVKNERNNKTNQVFYMPHLPVLRLNKNTKVRVVFDASAKQGKCHSLNECLLKGPLLLPNLVGVLLRFRAKPIVMIADIEKAFLQLGLDISDRDLTRFYWVKDVSLPPTNENLQVLRFCRVPFGIISSPFLLAAVLQQHLRNSTWAVAKQALSNLYVDNIILTTQNYRQAKYWFRKLKELFAEAFMNVRQFACNEKTIMKEIPDEDKISEETIEVMGVTWNMKEDSISVSTLKWPGSKITKRNILKFIAKHYDPFGFLGPILMPWKSLYQSLWLENTGWDEEIKPSIKPSFEKLLRSWREKTYELPRLCNTDQIKELHLFVDASKAGYVSAIYTTDDEGTSKLLYAKSRVNPIEGISIPRSELLSMLIGVRSLQFLKRELQVETPTYIWTDSNCVLSWIKCKDTHKLPKFVRNRVNEIQNTKGEFRHVTSDKNVADVLSRGVNISAFNWTNWVFGPKWLSDKTTWPTNEKVAENIEYSFVNVEMQSINLLQLKRYSSIDKAVRITKYALLFLKSFKSSVKLSITKEIKSKNDHFNATRIAEIIIIRQIQSELADNELFKWDLKADENKIYHFSARLSKLGNNLPIYLPRNRYGTELIILKYHSEQLHFGVPQTLCALRQKYWIDKGRSTVKRVIKKYCMVCKKHTAKPFKLPQMAELPKIRLYSCRPFQNIGIDMAGPIICKEKKRKLKRWIYLFTCLFTRAVHLEVVCNQSTAEFAKAFDRFKFRRGCPDSIVSDNAGPFVLLAKTENIRWEFITPYSPWKGGVYERLIGLFKSALNKTMNNKVLSPNDFINLVINIEYILNSRPLCQIDNDDCDFVRPIDFLCPRTSGVVDMCIVTSDMYSSPKCLKELFLSLKTTIEQFWKLWNKLYLNLLRERYTRNIKQRKFVKKREPNEGEVVILENQNQKRANWKLGRIIKVCRSEDNLIRSVIIETGNGITLQRPINLIYSLELVEDDVEVRSVA